MVENGRNKSTFTNMKFRTIAPNEGTNQPQISSCEEAWEKFLHTCFQKDPSTFFYTSFFSTVNSSRKPITIRANPFFVNKCFTSFPNFPWASQLWEFPHPSTHSSIQGFLLNFSGPIRLGFVPHIFSLQLLAAEIWCARHERWLTILS